MSSNVTPDPNVSRPDWSVRLAPARRQIETTLLALAGVAAILPITLAILHKQAAFGPVFFWGCALVAIFFAAGMLSMSLNLRDTTPSERIRVLVMGVVGGVGLATAILGFSMPFSPWWTPLLGGLEKWRENPWRLISCAASIFGGLSLMFIGLLAVRGMERSHQSIRWLVFGFNTLFGTLLLAFVLALINLLAYADPVDRAFGRFFSREYDWTQTQMYTLNARTENFLSTLDEKIKFIVVLPGDDIFARDTLTLLRNFQGRNKNVSFELLAPDVLENQRRISDMAKKYGIKDVGILVISGDPDGKHDHEFVPMNKLYQVRGGRGQQSRVFAGEGALLSAMATLVEGKVVIYFTKGHGEYELDGPPPMMEPRPKQEGTISTLRDRLTRDRNRFEVKTLTLDGTGRSVPDDASAVVVARPTMPFGPADMKVLRDYMARKEQKDDDGKVRVASGRMVLLLEAVTRTAVGSTTLVRTGMEDLAADFGIRVGEARVQDIYSTDPRKVPVITDFRSPCPVGRAFHPIPNQYTLFTFEHVLPIRPADGPKMGARPASTLMLAISKGNYEETDLGRDPLAVAANLREDPERFAKMPGRGLIPVAATSSDSGSGMPPDAAHAAARRDRPRMVVFGAASWASDAGLADREGNDRFDLFNSSLSWLREQGDIGQLIEVKVSMPYNHNIPETEFTRLRFLPLGLMLLGVIALGTGVWVVRRK